MVFTAFLVYNRVIKEERKGKKVKKRKKKELRNRGNLEKKKKNR